MVDLVAWSSKHQTQSRYKQFYKGRGLIFLSKVYFIATFNKFVINFCFLMFCKDGGAIFLVMSALKTFSIRWSPLGNTKYYWSFCSGCRCDSKFPSYQCILVSAELNTYTKHLSYSCKKQPLKAISLILRPRNVSWRWLIWAGYQ